MNGLYAAVYKDSSKSEILADLTRLQGGRLSTGPHGFERFTGFYPCMLADAYRLYDRPGLPHVLVSWNAIPVWEGRLEDLRIDSDAGGATLGAFGYWRALRRRKYTALWSTTRLAGWRPVLLTERADAYPDRYEFDTQNRLMIRPRKNATLGTTGVAKVGRIGYLAPSGGARQIVACSFDYSMRAPANWTAAFQTAGSTWGVIQTGWTLNGNGAEQTGNQSITFLANPADALMFYLYYNAADAAYAGETGDDWLRITNLRVQTTTAATVLADEIAGALAAFSNALNPTQLSAAIDRIESPAVDLRDELYEDAVPAEILDRLALLGDGAGNVWEAGVWEDRKLHFRPRGSAGLTWYTDAVSLAVDRSVDALANSVYAVYQDASGRSLRTAAATDADSVERWGETVEDAVKVQTTSSSQAQTHRDTRLADRATPIPRAGLRIGRIYDGAGVQYPKFLVRSGDAIVARNLPPTLSADVDRIRAFRIAETSYAIDQDDLTVAPESPLPALDVMVARQAAGAAR